MREGRRPSESFIPIPASHKSEEYPGWFSRSSLLRRNGERQEQSQFVDDLRREVPPVAAAGLRAGHPDHTKALTALTPTRLLASGTLPSTVQAQRDIVTTGTPDAAAFKETHEGRIPLRHTRYGDSLSRFSK